MRSNQLFHVYDDVLLTYITWKKSIYSDSKINELLFSRNKRDISEKYK